MERPPFQQRALGALVGVAIGDAMGMPTQTLTREEIARQYGAITSFRDAGPDQPVSAGLPAGTITDDTEQSILIAHHIIARRGRIDQLAWAQELLAWERDTHARGVNDLLGPSTKRAIEALQRGVPASETGRFGTTNGAAMRIVPVAIATPAMPLGELVDAVEESCRLTHHTSEAIGSASAVAAAVSCGIEGASIDEMLDTALDADRARTYPFCRLTGPANVLVMPGLHAASISTRLVQRFGAATSIGPILLGLQKPVQIVGMDASVSDMVQMALMAAHASTPKLL